MKTLEQFIKENNGKQVEVTGSANAKFQCVDLVNLYIRDVLGLPIVEWTNAQDFPKKCLPPKYEYILNGDTNFPLKGDIVIWSSKDNVGHIAICIENGNINNFKSFDQNWSKPLYCTLETHVYTGTNHKVIGWLRPSVIINDMTDNEKLLLGLINDNGITEGDIRWVIDLKAKQTVPKLEKKVTDLETEILEIKQQLGELTEKYNNNEKELKNCQSSLKTANQTIENISAELETANKDKTNYKSWYESKCKELNELKSKTTLIESIINFIKSLFKK